MRNAAVIYKRRKLRANQSAFDSLVSAPVSGAVTLPAGARLALGSVSGCVAGTTAATLVGTSNRTIQTPAMVAGEKLVLDWVEKDFQVTPNSDFELFLDSGLGVWEKIATGA